MGFFLQLLKKTFQQFCTSDMNSCIICSACGILICFLQLWILSNKLSWKLRGIYFICVPIEFAFIFSCQSHVRKLISLSLTHVLHINCRPFELFQKTLPPSHPCWNQNPIDSHLEQKCTMPTTSQALITGVYPTSSKVGRKPFSNACGDKPRRQHRNRTSAVNTVRLQYPGEQLPLRDLFACHLEHGSPTATPHFTSTFAIIVLAFVKAAIKRNVNGGGNHMLEEP